MTSLALLLAQILVVLLVARLLGSAARRLGQPAVIGEITAGLVLGPSVMGAMAPALSVLLFPPESLPILQLLSQIGVLLFMFLVGLELNWSDVRRQAKAALIISHASIVLPFLLGVGAALVLFADHARPGIPIQAFALFMGVAMSITAFPVLARILAERGLSTTPLGSMAITCAAAGDVTAWTLLAIVVAVVTAGGSLAGVVTAIVLAALVTIVMVTLVRSLLARVLTSTSPAWLGGTGMTIVIGVLLAAALTTELIGVHALFGAFLAGAVVPPDQTLRLRLRERLESVSTVLLLPLFFAYTGLRTEVAWLDGPSAWLMCLTFIALATLGKLGATAVTARLTGMGWRDAFVLGALMNTRGLMELIVLNVGLELGVISPEIFAALVVMALVTTAMTAPMVDMARRRNVSM